MTTGQLFCVIFAGWVVVFFVAALSFMTVCEWRDKRRAMAESRSWAEHVDSLPVRVVDRQREVQLLETWWQS